MAIAPGARKTQILHTLAQMLEQPQAARITTAALAARMQISEAALYRHFASKAQMFEGLIDQIDHALFGRLDAIATQAHTGAEQAGQMIVALLRFAQDNRGLTRVLTGDALVTEDKRLLERINQINESVQSLLCQAMRNGIVDGSAPAHADARLQASVFMHLVMGKWLRFAQSGWHMAPTDGIAAELAWLIPQAPSHDPGIRHTVDRA